MNDPLSARVTPQPLRRRLAVLRRVVTGADRRLASLTVLMLVFDALAAGLQSLALKWIVDAAIDGRTSAALLGAGAAGLATGGLAVTARVLGDVETMLANQTGLNVDRDSLRLTASMPGVEHLERPEFLDQLSIVRSSGADLFRAAFSVAQSVSVLGRIVIGVALLASINPVLVLLPLFAVPSALLVSRANHHVSAAEAEAAERRRASTQLHGLFLDPASAMEMRVFDALDALDQRSDDLWDEVGRITVRGALRAAAVSTIGWVVLTAGYVAALLFVAYEVTEGRATVGDLVLLAQLSLQLRASVNESTAVAQRAATALTTTDRFSWLDDLSRAQHRRFAGTEVVPSTLIDGVRLEGVSFTYPGTGTPILHNLTLDLPAGAVVAVVGNNGAGKTTLVKLLMRLYLPTEGRILVDGHDLSGLDGNEWALRTSGAFQDFLRMEARVRDAVGCADVAHLDDDETILLALEAAEGRTMVESWTDGLDTELGRSYRDGRELSGGQWQRLAIARAMMRRGPLLLALDEPTSELDPAAEHALYERYAGAARAASSGGGITLLVSHRFSSVRMADRILVLEDGVAAECGSHADLMALDGIYARMFRTQAAAYG